MVRKKRIDKDYDVPHWATERAYKNGYAKGVKEFAERLKEKAYSKADEVLYAYEIDNLVKEMVGADNATK